MAHDHDDEHESGTSRRRFCQATGVGACAVAAGGAAALSADFLRPRALFEPPTIFTLGPPDAIDIGGVMTSEVHQAYVVRLSDGFRAMSSVCTHLGCITRYQADEKVIACPCHGSRFSLDGDVLEGPAPRPLPWYEMDVSGKGEIVVDTGIEVPQGKVFKL